MDFQIVLVDWPELLKNIKSSSSPLDESDEFWAMTQSPRNWYDSNTMYTECGEILGWMVGAEETDKQKDALNALAFLIDPSYCKSHDVDESAFELIVASIKPERLANIETKLHHLPSPQELEALYNELPQAMRRTTRTSSFCKFNEYLQQWLDAIRTATQKGQGLLMFVG